MIEPTAPPFQNTPKYPFKILQLLTVIAKLSNFRIMTHLFSSLYFWSFLKTGPSTRNYKTLRGQIKWWTKRSFIWTAVNIRYLINKVAKAFWQYGHRVAKLPYEWLSFCQVSYFGLYFICFPHLTNRSHSSEQTISHRNNKPSHHGYWYVLPIKKVTKAFWQYTHCRGVIVAVLACCVLLLLSWNNKRKSESDELSCEKCKSIRAPTE